MLSEVEETPDVTQRQLSIRLGIALGLTNLMLRNLVQKGYVRVNQATWKKRLYTLTPDGFSRRLNLLLRYVTRVLDHYQTVRETLRQQLEPLALTEESRIAICGTGEFAEIVYLGLKELGIEEIDVFDGSATNGRRFLGIPVQKLTELRSHQYDQVVVASLVEWEKPAALLQAQGVSSDQLVVFFADGRTRRG